MRSGGWVPDVGLKSLFNIQLAVLGDVHPCSCAVLYLLASLLVINIISTFAR